MVRLGKWSESVRGFLFSPPLMNAPDKSREELIAAERAAERAVVTAEMTYRAAEATGAPDEEQAAAYDALFVARRDSLATRKLMADGLDAWTRYLAWREVVREAEANGVTLTA